MTKKVSNFGTEVEVVYLEDNWSGLKIKYVTKRDDKENTLESNTILVDSGQAMDIYNAIKYLYDLR
jgi:hypothetical protein